MKSVTVHRMPCGHVSQVEEADDGFHVRCCECKATKPADEVKDVNPHRLHHWPQYKNGEGFPKPTPRTGTP